MFVVVGNCLRESFFWWLSVRVIFIYGMFNCANWESELLTNQFSARSLFMNFYYIVG
jgi:hypothetical protein